MAVIYLKHPRHGRKVACGEHEAQMDRANGWVDYDPYEKPEPVEVPAFLAAPVEVPVTLVVDPAPVTEVGAPKAKAPKTLKDLSKG